MPKKGLPSLEWFEFENGTFLVYLSNKKIVCKNNDANEYIFNKYICIWLNMKGSGRYQPTKADV